MQHINEILVVEQNPCITFQIAPATAVYMNPKLNSVATCGCDL